MKSESLPDRINLLVQSLLNTLDTPRAPSSKTRSGQELPNPKHRHRSKRREFYYYKKLIDLDTQAVVGYMADISSGGFKLDCSNPIPVNRDIRFLISLTNELADKPHMTFVARSRWCRVDPFDPYGYNVGFQLLTIAPSDLEIFNRMLEKYGRDVEGRVVNLRRSNKW